MLVELDHTIAFRIVDIVAEHTCALAAFGLSDGLAQCGAQTVTVEDVVAQHERARLAVDELLSQEECLRQTIRAGLHLIGKMHAVMRTVAEELFEVRQVLRRGDDQDVTDARKHEHAERIVDHRLVIHRQQLLRRDGGQRVKAGAGTSGENDALHTLVLPWS